MSTFSNDPNTLKKSTDKDIIDKYSDLEKKENSAFSDNSKIIIIVLSVVLAIVVISLTVFITLYFSKRSDNDKIAETDTSIVVSETASPDTSEIPAFSSLEYDKYIGFWHMENCGEQELTIHSINTSTVTFSLWCYSIWSSNIMTATLNDNIATFSNNEIEGTLTFESDSIILDITMSSVPGYPSHITEIYNMRIDESAQYIDEINSFEPYILQVVNPELNVYDNPSYSANVVYTITDQLKYTIVEEQYDVVSKSMWGKLKSGIGWINLPEAMNEFENNTSSSGSSENTTETTTQSTTEDSKQTTTQSTTEDSKQTTTQAATEEENGVVAEVKTKEVNGVVFNYVSYYYWSSDDIGITEEMSIEVDIEYCEPNDYLDGNQYPTQITRNNYIYDEDEIGNVYYTAYNNGLNDFKIFKISVKANRYESYDGIQYYSKPTIDYRRYNSYGTLIKDYISGLVELEAFTGEENVPNIDETFYVGLQSSSVARIDLIVFRLNPEDYK